MPPASTVQTRPTLKMGVFADRGVHYLVRFRDGTWRTLLGSAQTDERLLQSALYRGQRDTWVDKAYREGECRVRLGSPPILVTEEEDATIQAFLDANADRIMEHGWYDVCSVGDSYEPR